MLAVEVGWELVIQFPPHCSKSRRRAIAEAIRAVVENEGCEMRPQRKILLGK